MEATTAQRCNPTAQDAPAKDLVSTRPHGRVAIPKGSEGTYKRPIATPQTADGLVSHANWYYNKTNVQNAGPRNWSKWRTAQPPSVPRHGAAPIVARPNMQGV